MRSHPARFVAGAAEPARLPALAYPEIAFAGRSNVGKSSLLNRLVGNHKLARVSKTPGRTQQINFFLVDERRLFVDLPGYGFARVPLAVKEQWKHLVESYLTGRSHLRAVVVIIDLRRGVEPDDAMLLDVLQARAVPAILVATKADKLGRGARAERMRALAKDRTPGVAEIIVLSAATGEGVDQLWHAIDAVSQR